MKEIKNWEALILKDGKKVTAIPLPGCIIKGELEGEEIEINATDINITSLTVFAGEQKYRLSGARPSYLGILDNYIEIGKEKNIQVPDINIETLGIENKGFER